jgi:hypothetical protein
VTTSRFGLLFHFTHIDNLPAILEQGALYSDAAIRSAGRLANEAGDPAIKQRRRGQPVTCSPGGYVGDYVPFYFAARSPMMLKLKSGRVPTFTGDHRDLVYMVSDVSTIVAGGVAFAISDRNAAVAVAEFTNDASELGDLSQPHPQSAFIDWPLMQRTQWHDTPEYPDRMERRMAEFLVHDRVPLNLLLGAGVYSGDQKARVEQLFADWGCELPVVVKPDWYYS